MSRKLSIFAVFSFCLLTLTILDATAQNLQGCGKVGSFQIYYQRNGFGSGLNFLLPRYDAPISTLTTNTAICPRFTSATVASPTTACCIGATDCTNNLVYNFTNIPCPIDTNSGILLVVMAGVGGLVVRKRMS
ncbi:hypothetical protein EA772_10340 [Pedobacter sp. G11]|uniref:hypothetical protein n=1 Tax=Pedobacter sp. G11 TaxID=2482728 RepID=UPI000F5DFA1E|nr:hypothetical protein [Pedobacter sp. G11]AZI25722.1 hypothetical protein EA772_10340 [Pedobacter sp. G11]